MNDMVDFVSGLLVLAQYDDSGGDISASYGGVIFAGPQDEENVAQISAKDAALLESWGWFFDKWSVRRWGWRH